MITFDKLSGVVDWRLCLGCGACAYICPEKRVVLKDFPSEGIRPVVEGADCGACLECLDVCPAIQSDFRPEVRKGTKAGVFSPIGEWGPLVALWEGHASDEAIRHKGSSGGVLTALGAYCIEVLAMEGVLHIGQDPLDPVRNRTRLSRTRAELLQATGSRYSPASVCNGLGLVEEALAPCVIIGKPAEIAAVRNARKLRPKLDSKVGVTLSFFCAETPSTQGTVDLLLKLGIGPDGLRDLRYRGDGWPGFFAPTRKGEANPRHRLTYQQSWAFLQAYRPWSVQLWPDSAGELADITCGDPWYHQPDGKNPGFSLVLARTQRGREIVEGAIKAGYVILKPAEQWKLNGSQAGLLEKKGAIRGRRLAMTLLGLPVTKLPGLDLKRCWRPLSFLQKARAIAGTVTRVLRRKLYRPLVLDATSARPVGVPLDSGGTSVLSNGRGQMQQTCK